MTTMLTTHRHARGFSLVEVMVAAAISLIIFGAGFVTISGTINAKKATSARIRATEDARLFYSLLERDLAAAFPAFTIATKADLIEPGAASTDRIEFFTSADVPVERPDGKVGGTTDEYIFVQYYVNTKKQLCRKVTSSATYDFELQPLPDIDDNDKYALLEGISRLKIQHRTWIPESKDYSPPLSSTNDGSPASSTHLQVRLLLEKDRAFVKVLPLTNAFKQ